MTANDNSSAPGPDEDQPIVFRAEVTRVLEGGDRCVRLANGHHLRALPDAEARVGPEPGDRVTVQLTPEEREGWRLAPSPPGSDPSD